MKYRAASIAFALLTYTAAANAVQVRVEYEGVVSDIFTGVPSGLDLDIGTSVSGYFIYETDIAPWYSDIEQSRWDDVVVEFGAQIGDVTSVPGPPDDSGSVLFNNSLSGPELVDSFSFFASTNSSLGADWEINTKSFSFTDTTPTPPDLFSNVAGMPRHFPPFAEVNWSGSFTLEQGSQQVFGLYTPISVTATLVPEPAEWTMLLCGLVVTGYVLQNRRLSARLQA
jgi:hypothetical protein